MDQNTDDICSICLCDLLGDENIETFVEKEDFKP